MNGLRLRADKPRRALAAEQPQLRSTHSLRQLLKRGATVAVVSGVAIAGFSAFTASSTNSAGVAFAQQGPLAVSSIPALKVAASTSTPSLADLAAQRSQQLAQNGEAVVDSQEQAVADARSSALTGSADAIAKEVERLKTLSRFMWPATGGVGSVFGMRLHPILHIWRMHDGDDIGGTCGEPIWAAQSGIVTKAELGYNGGSGNNVWIDHGAINGVDVSSGYLHMEKISVSLGQRVNKGDVIGYVGSTGLSTACHLHFSVKKNGAQSDPMEYIGWNPQSTRLGKDAGQEG